jgi:amidase
VDEQVATWSAVAQLAAIRDGGISSRELLELYLDRIERLDGPINAVVTKDAERARAASDAADVARARGERAGLLHGLPITIKDAIETEGIRSTAGSVDLTDHVPAQDAPAVAQLKAAGAIVFGKTNTPKWCADVETFNRVFGVTNNPWDVTRTTGGSSGGSAAAVASGFTSADIGTDHGGSIRIPSHCCGVFGLKPSFGVVPQRGYLNQVGGGATDVDLNVFGPIARSADDLDLLLTVLAGPAPELAAAWRVDLPSCDTRSLADVRIGTWFDVDAAPLDVEYRALLRDTVDTLADARAAIDDSHPPVEFAEQRDLFWHMVMAAAAPSLSERVAEASAGSHLAWLRAENARARLRRVWAEWFDEYDVLLCPALAVPAFPHVGKGPLDVRTVELNGETRPMADVLAWPGMISVVGLPSALVPIGRTRGGLPVGMQVVAPYLHDRRAVRVAKLISEVTGGYTPPPGF